MNQVIENIRERLEDFFHENTRLAAVLAAFLFSFALIAFFMGIFQLPQKPRKTAEEPKAIPYTAVKEFYPPEQQPLTEEYYFMRKQTSKWPDEEFNRWFTVPDKAKVEELGKANDKLTQDVLGVAP